MLALCRAEGRCLKWNAAPTTRILSWNWVYLKVYNALFSDPCKVETKHCQSRARLQLTGRQWRTCKTSECLRTYCPFLSRCPEMLGDHLTLYSLLLKEGVKRPEWVYTSVERSLNLSFKHAYTSEKFKILNGFNQANVPKHKFLLVYMPSI